MKKKILISVFSTFFLLVAVEACQMPIVHGHSGDVLSAWAFVTPTIDGVLSPGEWDDAAVATFTLTYDEESHDVTLYIKNNRVNLYVAAIVENDEYNQWGIF